MASPFANAGLGQFGSESKYMTGGEMPGWMQGIKDAGIVALKNMVGIPPAQSSSVAPIAPVAPVGVSPNSTVNTATQDSLTHPELELASQTNPFALK